MKRDPKDLDWIFSGLASLMAQVLQTAPCTPEGKEALDYLMKADEAMSRLSRRWKNGEA